MNKILIIEDDLNLGKLISTYLKEIGYLVVWATNGKEAFRFFNAENIDLCIVDIGLPDKDGFEIVRDIKQIDREVPIIFLTARNQINDKITAFQTGADDYICKPFLMKELELRIQAISKRFKSFSITNSVSNHEIILGLYTFNFAVRTLTINGKKIKLSHIDCELLKLLCINCNSIVKKDIILKAIWDDADFISSRRLSVYLNRIRKYLNQDPSIEIQNVYGSGYKLQYNTNH